MSEHEGLGDRLAAVNGIRDPGESERRGAAMREVVARERSFVRRLGWLAIVAWSLTLLLPVAGVMAALTQVAMLESGGDASAGYGTYIVTILFGAIGALALIAAILFTVGWLLRSRSTGLAMIEARLDELEGLLEHERAGHR